MLKIFNNYNLIQKNFKYWKLELFWHNWNNFEELTIELNLIGFNRKSNKIGKFIKSFYVYTYYSESKNDAINSEEFLLYEFYKYLKNININIHEKDDYKQIKDKHSKA